MNDLVKQTRGALIYPAFMLLMCITVTIFLLTLVLPKFAEIYATKKAVLPLPTRILMAASSGLVDHWLFWLVFTAAAAAGLSCSMLPVFKS